MITLEERICIKISKELFICAHWAKFIKSNIWENLYANTTPPPCPCILVESCLLELNLIRLKRQQTPSVGKLNKLKVKTNSRKVSFREFLVNLLILVLNLTRFWKLVPKLGKNFAGFSAETEFYIKLTVWQSKPCVFYAKIGSQLSLQMNEVSQAQLFVQDYSF